MPYSYDVEEIVLDINDGIPYSMPDVRVKSGDRNSRKLVAQITYNGKPYDLSNVSASFYMLKPDGTKVFTSAEIIDATQGRISANFTEQMLSVAGNAKGEFLFTRGNDSLLSTPVFKIIIDASINDKNAIESASEFSALVDALDSVHNLDDQIERLDTELRDAIEHLTEIEDDVAIIDETLALAKDFTGANEHRLVQDKDKMDYLGNVHDTIRDARNATVDWMLGEINTLDYEGQHITATDTIEGHTKSAILKGQTLVNLCQNLDNEISTSNSLMREKISVNANTTYMVVAKVKSSNPLSSVTFSSFFRVDNVTPNYVLGGVVGDITTEYTTKSFTFDTGDTTAVAFHLRNAYRDWGLTENIAYVKEVMLIEYQDGMENWDIPYFGGMQSVIMPVLTTTGKNLFDIGDIGDSGKYIKNDSGTLVADETSKFSYNYTKVQPSTEYYLEMGGIQRLYFYNNKKQWIGRTEQLYTTGVSTSATYATFTTPENCHYIQIQYRVSELETSLAYLVMGKQATSYEPYQSNILTVNEEVELRGIGGIKDELNLSTGELTQRIGEMVLDGSEEWVIAHTKDTTLTFKLTNHKMKSDGVKFNDLTKHMIICNNLKNNGNVYLSDIDGTGYIFDGAMNLYIGIEKDKLASATNTDFKQWLNSNPIVFQYKLATESVKTVDLSDNVVYSYDEVTHYDCSSEAGSLIPTLSVDVPTNLSALVSRQRATIETLETENRALKEGQVELELGHEQQEEEIISTQDAVNFLLFDVLDMAPYELDQKEYDRMAVYIANQIIRGKVTYQLAVSKYPQFLTDIDEILVNEGRGDLIVKID